MKKIFCLPAKTMDSVDEKITEQDPLLSIEKNKPTQTDKNVNAKNTKNTKNTENTKTLVEPFTCSWESPFKDLTNENSECLKHVRSQCATSLKLLEQRPHLCNIIVKCHETLQQIFFTDTEDKTEEARQFFQQLCTDLISHCFDAATPSKVIKFEENTDETLTKHPAYAYNESVSIIKSLCRLGKRRYACRYITILTHYCKKLISYPTLNTEKVSNNDFDHILRLSLPTIKYLAHSVDDKSLKNEFAALTPLVIPESTRKTLSEKKETAEDVEEITVKDNGTITLDLEDEDVAMAQKASTHQNDSKSGCKIL